MIEPKYNVELRGFSDQVVDPVDALMRGFGVSAARAESILERLPAVVKRRAKHSEALRYASALMKLGGDVVVLDDERGERVSLEELASFDPKQSGIIASADPGAKGRQVPRAAFRSGSHPALSYPRIAPSVATTPTSLTALSNAQTDQVSGSSDQTPRPSAAHRDASGGPAGKAVGERMMVELEHDFGASDSSGVWGDVMRGAPGLELDETAIRAGREGSTVPAMPAVLQQIRDFEATGWEPLRPDVGLSVGGVITPPVSGGLDSGVDGALGGAESAAGATRGRSSGQRTPGARHSGSRRAESVGAGSRPRGTSGPQKQTVVIAVIVGGLVVAAIFFGARWLGGVSSAIEQRLRDEAQRQLPGLEIQDISAGSLGVQETAQESVSVRLGRCYGWIAYTEEMGCDLDLYLYNGGGAITGDIAYNNLPVVFHCPDTDGELGLRVSNAGVNGCDYGLASLEGLGSVGWPLEPYLNYYARRLSLDGLGGPFVAIDDIRHGTLGPGGSERFELFIPVGSCYNVLAVVQQGSDLDAVLSVEGDVVARDELVDNYPIVGYCATDRDVWAEVELTMYAGSGPFVWQTFEGQPLN